MKYYLEIKIKTENCWCLFRVHLANCQVRDVHRSYERSLKQKRIETWKSQGVNGVWTRNLATPLRRSKQLSYELVICEFY